MRIVKRNRGLGTLGAAAVGFLACAGVASADVTTEQSGSILVWPKIVWDGTRDTVIQISNTGNPMAFVHCFYVNGATGAACGETDFWLLLTRQQPTQWTASQGRRSYPFDPFGSPGAGLDPGLVPPVPVGFTGELKCIQIDETGAPTPGNKLKGEATVVTRAPAGDVHSYSALAFLGNPELSGSEIGNELALDLTPQHPSGEYNACPDTTLINHFAYDAPDMVSNATVKTALTLVPCFEDLENQIPGKVTLQYQIFNEYEQPFSTSTTITCWADLELNRIGAGSAFTYGTLGTLSAYSRMNPNPGQGGVIGIATETRGNTTAAFNLNIEGNRYDSATDGKGNRVTGATDTITIPAQ